MVLLSFAMCCLAFPWISWRTRLQFEPRTWPMPSPPSLEAKWWNPRLTSGMSSAGPNHDHCLLVARAWPPSFVFVSLKRVKERENSPWVIVAFGQIILTALRGLERAVLTAWRALPSLIASSQASAASAWRISPTHPCFLVHFVC
jgi:hypothetical protein